MEVIKKIGKATMYSLTAVTIAYITLRGTYALVTLIIMAIGGNIR
jgi:hypothetical protein